MARQRVGVELGADQGKQSVEAQTHIDRLGTKPELDGWREAQHETPPRAQTRERTLVKSQPGGMRTTTPVVRTRSTLAEAVGSRTGSRGTSRGGLGSWSEARAWVWAAKRRLQE
jgi:hypothetical protein